MVLTHSDEWKTSTDWLRDNTKSEGKVAIGNAIKELKAAGYLKITPLYTEGRFNGHVWSWSDAPQEDNDQNSRNQDSCNEESRKQDFILENKTGEHQKAEGNEEQPSDSADGEPRETASPQGKPPVSHPKSSAPPPPTPRQRNLLGETMLEVCWGIADYTKATAAQWSLASKTLKELKQVQPDLTPEMLREFATRMRREWDGRSFTPAAIAKHWRPIPASGNGIPESHPFPGSARVTTAELVARFPSGPEQAKWRRRLMEEGRY